MSDPVTGFLEKATGFIRNPLGIIGLFIALIYGTAVVVSGASPHLTDDQRWVLIVFAAAFPLLVLGTFYKLVTEHHSKLYAPSDWRDERNVFGPQSVETKLERENAEVQAIAATEVATEVLPARSEQPRLSPPPVAASTTRSDIRALVREAENLAFRRLSSMYRQRIFRDIAIDGPNKVVAFDGLISEPNRRITAFEVKFIRRLNNLRNVIEPVAANAAIAASSIERFHKPAPFELILVLVTEGMSNELRERARKVATEMLTQGLRGISATVLVFDLEELRSDEAELGMAEAAVLSKG